jgi:hypothetical protein
MLANLFITRENLGLLIIHNWGWILVEIMLVMWRWVNTQVFKESKLFLSLSLCMLLDCKELFILTLKKSYCGDVITNNEFDRL